MGNDNIFQRIRDVHRATGRAYGVLFFFFCVMVMPCTAKENYKELLIMPYLVCLLEKRRCIGYGTSG